MALVLKSNSKYQGDISELPNISLLDLYPGAYAAYSLRKLSRAYQGAAVRAVRQSDGETLDIGFDDRGDLDTASVLSFAAGGEVRLNRWFDQSGFGRDAIRSSTFNQPLLTDSNGDLFYKNGKPSLRFTGDSSINTGGPLKGLINAASSVQLFAVCSSDGPRSERSGVFTTSTSTTSFSVVQGGNSRNWGFLFKRQGQPGGTLFTDFSHEDKLSVLHAQAVFSAGYYAFKQLDKSYAFNEGSGAVQPTTDADSTFIGEGTGLTAGQRLIGNICEMVFYKNMDISANVRGNSEAYYGVK